jgi:hypothetical protein
VKNAVLTVGNNKYVFSKLIDSPPQSIESNVVIPAMRGLQHKINHNFNTCQHYFHLLVEYISHLDKCLSVCLSVFMTRLQPPYFLLLLLYGQTEYILTPVPMRNKLQTSITHSSNFVHKIQHEVLTFNVIEK